MIYLMEDTFVTGEFMKQISTFKEGNKVLKVLKSTTTGRDFRNEVYHKRIWEEVWLILWCLYPRREGRHGDVWAESWRDRPDSKAWCWDSAKTVRRNLGALRRHPVSPECNWEQAGQTHVCHGHAAESVKVEGALTLQLGALALALGRECTPEIEPSRNQVRITYTKWTDFTNHGFLLIYG